MIESRINLWTPLVAGARLNFEAIKSKMGNVVYVFGDESGNLDFSNNQGASRYFILTTVMMENCSVGDALLQLRRELAWKDVLLTEQFHAASDRQEVRDYVFESIAGFDFRVDATILEKRKTVERYRCDVSEFYRLAWWFHLKYVGQAVHRDDKVLLVAASLGERKKKQAFSDAFDAVALQTVSHADFHTAFWHDATDPCLQVADYCGWAIQRQWERHDDRSYALIEHKIASEFDAFRLGSKLFY